MTNFTFNKQFCIPIAHADTKIFSDENKCGFKKYIIELQLISKIIDYEDETKRELFWKINVETIYYDDLHNPYNYHEYSCFKVELCNPFEISYAHQILDSVEDTIIEYMSRYVKQGFTREDLRGLRKVVSYPDLDYYLTARMNAVETI